MKYYIMHYGQQTGPMDAAELRNYGVTPETKVWREGLPEWVPASSLPELAFLFNNAPSGAYHTAAPGYQPSSPVMIDNNMTMAIIATVVGFIFSCIGCIFGIIAIVKANKVQPLANEGRVAEAVEMAKSVRTMSMIAFVFAGIGLIWSICMWIF